MRETPETWEWTGSSGHECRDPNLLTRKEHDALSAYDSGIARKQLNQLFRQDVPEGSPFRMVESKPFDLVFTFRVLIHIAIEDMGAAIDAIHRCAGTCIWGMECYSAPVAEASYRNRTRLLSKTDYAKPYLDRFEDFELAQEQALPCLDDENVDSMFLLRKKKGAPSSPLGMAGHA